MNSGQSQTKPKALNIFLIVFAVLILILILLNFFVKEPAPPVVKKPGELTEEEKKAILENLRSAVPEGERIILTPEEKMIILNNLRNAALNSPSPDSNNPNP